MNHLLNFLNQRESDSAIKKFGNLLLVNKWFWITLLVVPCIAFLAGLLQKVNMLFKIAIMIGVFVAGLIYGYKFKSQSS